MNNTPLYPLSISSIDTNISISYSNEPYIIPTALLFTKYKPSSQLKSNTFDISDPYDSPSYQSSTSSLYPSSHLPNKSQENIGIKSLYFFTEDENDDTPPLPFTPYDEPETLDLGQHEHGVYSCEKNSIIH
eukprot:475024_1